jgi:alkyl sulfatase BDS1-like metallo-beta-lactamase superfamily hydrolase
MAFVSLLFLIQPNLFSQQRSEPSVHTKEANRKVQESLPFKNTRDFELAQRGLLSPLDPQVVPLDDSTLPFPAWDLTKYKDQMPVDGVFPDPPDSVNPSLWRMAVLNSINGVFTVVPDAIYQIRGQDLANMTAVLGETGWLIIDPLTTTETARAALANLNREYLKLNPDLDSPPPVKNVIFTHSHVDHYGGINGLIAEGGSLDDFTIYAPEGFYDEAVSENVIAGNVMGRRASYMYGTLLLTGPKGKVDGGLGKGVSRGQVSLVQPDEEIIADGKRTIDGIDIIFQLVPGSEAPAEMMFYFPRWKAFCAAEDVTHTFHNVLTLRGANVRDPLQWSKYLDETLERFSDMEVVFASHHWPTWNYTEDNEPLPGKPVQRLIRKQRDMFRYIHDQSMRLTNQGYTIQEVGEMVEFTPGLANFWANRNYYGTVNHNAKAVYQKYIGWFDGNPASLHQLPPVEASKKYVEYMGGVKAILKKAKKDYEAGNYRWVAMAMNHVVFATAGEEKQSREVKEAIQLQANAYDQLGYQAESGPWRNFYLTGADELRRGAPTQLPEAQMITEETAKGMTLEMIFDFMAVHMNGPRAGENRKGLVLNLQLTEPTSQAVLRTQNGVLNYEIGEYTMKADATLIMTRDTLNKIVVGNFSTNGITVQPDTPEAKAAAEAFMKKFDTFNFWFNIVSPNLPQNPGD